MEKISGKEIKVVDISNDEIDKKYKELGCGKNYGMKCKLWIKIIGME